MRQQTFSDIEYGNRRKKTKREEFFDIMEELIPWEEWISRIKPFYYDGKRGRPPKELEMMLRMWLIENWFELTDEETEDAVYDSYAMRSFIKTDFVTCQAPDSSTLRRFRHIMEKHGLKDALFKDMTKRLSQKSLVLRSGKIRDAAAKDKFNRDKSKEIGNQPALWDIELMK